MPRPPHDTSGIKIMRALSIMGALLAILGSFALPVRSASAFTNATITIDGQFNDWAGIKSDPDNAIGDTVLPTDPDYPGQPDRDVYLCNVTSDDEYLYFSWRRTASGSKAITFGAYIDKAGDGKLNDGDLVVNWVVSTGQPTADAHAPSPSAWILLYNQARTKTGNTVSILNPGGDNLTNMGDDGDTPDGWASIQDGQLLPVKPMDGALNATNGIECEARVAWSDLGLAPDSPIKLHIATGNGNAWGTKYAPSTTWKWVGSPAQYLEENRGQVEDNCGMAFSFRRYAVSLTPDNAGTSVANSWVTYTHTIRNSGNVADTFDLSGASSNGWATQVTDAGGTPITSVSLAASESATIRYKVFIPAGTSDTTRDSAVLTATSRGDRTVSDSVTDVTAVGPLTIFPNRTGTMAPGQTIEYRFTVTNSTGLADTFDLTTLSSLGFPNTLTSAGGAPISAVALSSGESTTVVLRVSVPVNAAFGAQDVTWLIATSRTSSSINALATATTRVMTGLDISPNRTAEAGAGSTVTYAHTVTNSWPTSRTVTLSTTDSRGWPVVVYDSDGITPITSVVVGPNGDTRTVFVRVFVPGTAAAGASDTTTITAGAGASIDTAVDTTIVRRLALYDSPSYANQSALYDQGATVHALGAGLGAYSNVYFVWKNPSGAIVRTSPDGPVDTGSMAYDNYSIPTTATLGTWTCELRDAKNDALLEVSEYQVRIGAEITALWATDAAKIGENVTIDATHVNHSVNAITGSSATYTIWWDSNW